MDSWLEYSPFIAPIDSSRIVNSIEVDSSSDSRFMPEKRISGIAVEKWPKNQWNNKHKKIWKDWNVTVSVYATYSLVSILVPSGRE